MAEDTPPKRPLWTLPGSPALPPRLTLPTANPHLFGWRPQPTGGDASVGAISKILEAVLRPESLRQRKPELDRDALNEFQKLGKATTAKEQEESMAALDKLAANGSAQAAFLLARQYLQAPGFEDPSKGEAVLKRARDLGHVKAILELQKRADATGQKVDYFHHSDAKTLTQDLRDLFFDPCVGKGMAEYYARTNRAGLKRLAMWYWGDDRALFTSKDRAEELLNSYIRSGPGEFKGNLAEEAEARRAGWNSVAEMKVGQLLNWANAPTPESSKVKAQNHWRESGFHSYNKRLGIERFDQALKREIEEFFYAGYFDLPGPALLISVAKRIAEHPAIREVDETFVKDVITAAFENICHRYLTFPNSIAYHIGSTALTVPTKDWWAMYEMVLVGKDYVAYEDESKRSTSRGSYTASEYNQRAVWIFHRSKFLRVEHTRALTQYGLGLGSDTNSWVYASGGEYICTLMKGKPTFVMKEEGIPDLKFRPIEEIVLGHRRDGTAEWQQYYATRQRI